MPRAATRTRAPRTEPLPSAGEPADRRAVRSARWQLPMARREEAAQVAAPTAETYEILADAWQRLGLRDEVMAETGTHGGYAPRRGAKYKERDRGSKVR